MDKRRKVWLQKDRYENKTETENEGQGRSLKKTIKTLAKLFFKI